MSLPVWCAYIGREINQPDRLSSSSSSSLSYTPATRLTIFFVFVCAAVACCLVSCEL